MESSTSTAAGADKCFLECIDISHGHEEELGRFLALANDAAARQGITLEFGTFDDLMATNQRNLDSWMPITTTFRPDEGGANADNGFVVLGRNGEGDIVTTQAGRHFDWSDSNFKREAEALRLFYANPKHCQPGEQCRVTNDRAEEISGRVAYMGGLWFRPDYRGGGRVEIFPRIGRAVALARWSVDHVTCLIATGTLNRDFQKRTGFFDVLPKAVHLAKSPCAPAEVLELSICRSTSAQMIDDLSQFNKPH